MDVHCAFAQWAVSRGVALNGIAAHPYPGRGCGIIAKWRLEAGEILLTAPTSTLRTVHTVPESISRPIGTISVHGLLAANLAMDASEVYALWRAVMPPKESFEESMPLMWNSRLQALLPPASRTLVEKQEKKLRMDWIAVSTAFPTLSHNLYVYNWFLVNTRTFYYAPKAGTRKPPNRDDCLAFVPLADYFNHADVGCEVTFSPTEYKIRTNRQIEAGEEIYISYGGHSNDFLLAEYGFILDENKWDEISLDEVILPLFSKEQKQKLEEAGYLGSFVLDREQVCYRTQVALRLLCMSPGRWQRVVAYGLGDEDKHRDTANDILRKVLQELLGRVTDKIKQINRLKCGLVSQKKMLKKRWEQIATLLTDTLNRVS